MYKNYISLLKAAFPCLLSAISIDLNAQQSWAMALIENGMTSPTIVEYHSIEEKVENGTVYFRIYDDGYRFRNEPYNPTKLQYGYRISDKEIYIYDFENQKESIAFNFNLSEGDHFTTFNGMEWVVESAKDTLVNMSFRGNGESTTKRLLSVKTVDGKFQDKWLEDFGSFSNHFMINSLENTTFSQTLWMEYEMGEYIAREISADPFFTHDSGWIDGSYDVGEETTTPSTKCSYENGKLVIEDIQEWYDHREYTCFYRDGDNINKFYGWELEPQVDGEEYSFRKDVITLNGLPSPTTGQYIVHMNGNDFSTNVGSVRNDKHSSNVVYDIQGRKLGSEPAKGLIIKDKKCILAK